MKDNNRKDGRINSPFRHKVEMEHVGFDYNDHIASYLEREKAKGDYAYNQANNKVISSYSDVLQGRAYGMRNPEFIEDLDYQHYSNPFNRAYELNKRKNAPRVSLITKKPAKVQANLNVNSNTNSNKTSSHFAESNGWQKTNGWTDEFKKNWNKGDKVRSGLVSAGGLLASKFANWSWKHMVVAGAATTAALTVGLYSGYKKLEDK